MHMYKLLYSEPTKLMLVTGCSPVTTFIAEAAIMWNQIVVGFLILITVIRIEQIKEAASNVI